MDATGIIFILIVGAVLVIFGVVSNRGNESSNENARIAVRSINEGINFFSWDIQSTSIIELIDAHLATLSLSETKLDTLRQTCQSLIPELMKLNEVKSKEQSKDALTRILSQMKDCVTTHKNDRELGFLMGLVLLNMMDKIGSDAILKELILEPEASEIFKELNRHINAVVK